MLPEGWKNLPLGDIARVTSGGTPDRSEPQYWGGNIPWVTTGEIQFNTITDTTEKITDAGLASSSAKCFPVGTLLMAMYGQGKTRGQVAKLGIAASTNQACAAILLNDGHDSDFYFHVLSNQYDALRKLGNAGTQKNLNAGIIKQVFVPVPPVGEQHGIAAALAVWDAAITTTERLLANSREQGLVLAQRLMSGRTRQKGTLPWKKRKLSELMRESRVLGSGGHEARKLTVKLYAKGVIEKSSRSAGSESTQYYRRSAGQFIYSKLDFLNGAFGLVPAELDGYESTLDLPAFDLLPDVDARWLLYFVSREEFYRSQLGLANGGRKARRVNPKDLLQIAIPVPGIMEQQAIADALDLAWKIARDDEAQLRSLRIEKSALMQQLLTGKRRVCLPAATEAVAC